MKRGLVTHDGGKFRKDPVSGRLYADINHYPFHLTPAGECVVKLLQYAGLMNEKPD